MSRAQSGIDVFVANYGLVAEFEAEIDDPSTEDNGLDLFSAPKFTEVLGSLDNLDLVLNRVEEDYKRGLVADEAPELHWEIREHQEEALELGNRGGEAWVWVLTDHNIAVAVVIIQRTTVQA
jgi:hypothetical protein